MIRSTVDQVRVHLAMPAIKRRSNVDQTRALGSALEADEPVVKQGVLSDELAPGQVDQGTTKRARSSEITRVGERPFGYGPARLPERG